MKVLFEQDILKENKNQAGLNKAKFGKTLVINIIGSPGCGKTTILERTLDELVNKFRIAVIEGDIYTAKDAERIERYNVPVIQCNTAGGCHLSADIISRACAELNLENLDILFIENVGNLVCPAEFDLGEDYKVAVLSVVEGDDKPSKYPLLFQEAAIVILNKCDFLSLTNFNMDSAEADIRGLNPGAPIIQLSAVSGNGFDNWIEWIERKAAKKNI